MSEHTKEPWRVAHDEGDEYYIEVTSRLSGHICQLGSGYFSEDDARRIVACVNACAGISTEKLERGVIKELMDMVDRLSREITALPTDCAGQNCHACANPCDKYIESLR